ncbi:hypothetical protein D5F01_LYC23790 [Larimichthys crocea]|uniref:Uncharacterized protein n=1 Tax=Larimichthys crocea TaxID=215358 RepID=A0A6G0HG40_LARCR|nr:hypothetical protein D5F01_LYC23790 [Larimichthys crocea]
MNPYFFTSLGHGEAKDLVRYFRMAWAEIGPHPSWIYPTVLRKVGLAPTTVVLGQTTLVTRELRKLHKDLGRTVLGHQGLIKQKKGLRLIPKEDLARCQTMAWAKMPSLLGESAIEKAPPWDPRMLYRFFFFFFFGYLAAYLSSIYGHRTGVLTRMCVKEVMEHKTVRKFGTAQLYLEAEEYGWFRNWLRLRSRAVPTNPFFFSSLGRREAEDLICYFRMEWAEMGLKGACALWSSLKNVLFPQ